MRAQLRGSPPELASQFACQQDVVRRYLQAEADDRIFDPGAGGGPASAR